MSGTANDKMREIRFFAANRDLVPVFHDVERLGKLKYVRTGLFLISEPLLIINSGVDIPRLGKADAESGIACETYLVCSHDTRVAQFPIPGNRERISIDQRLNPDSGSGCALCC
jgi:hypothetical protein